MPVLDITRGYREGEIFLEEHIDSICDAVETLVNTTKVDDENIQSGGIETAVLIDTSVSTAKIADLAITTIKIADTAVTTAKILDSAVTAAKIANSAVTTAKINNSAVDVSKITAGAITNIKLSTVGEQVSTEGTQTVTASGFTSVCSVSFTTDSTAVRTVWVKLQGSSTNSASPSYVGTEAADNFTRLNWQIKRDSTVIASGFLFADRVSTGGQTNLQIIPDAIEVFDGNASTNTTYTYAFEIEDYPKTASSAVANKVKLVCFQLK